MATHSYECPNGCHNYRQSLEEIVTAGNKHKEMALSLKGIAEEQKKKISILREDKFKLQEEIDKMEMDAREEHDNFMKTAKQNIILKETIKAFELELISKEHVENEHQARDLQGELDLAERKNKDLEDELLAKDQQVFVLTETVEKFKDNELGFRSSASQSLDNEINPKEEIELENVVKDLQAKIENMKANEESKRNQRMALVNKERSIFESRKSNFESLRQSITMLEAKRGSFPRCFYGIKCRKIFCKFDHTHLFRKDNRKESSSGRNSTSNDKSSLEFLCDHCGQVCDSRIEFDIHVQRKHTGSVESSTPKDFNCNFCDKTFDRQKTFEMHIKNCHREFQCTICDNFFASEEELGVHKERVHTKGDQHQSEVSENALKNNDMLRSHIRANHGKMQYQEENIESFQNLVTSDNEFDSENSETSSISFENFSETEDSETESGGSSS